MPEPSYLQTAEVVEELPTTQGLPAESRARPLAATEVPAELCHRLVETSTPLALNRSRARSVAAQFG